MDNKNNYNYWKCANQLGLLLASLFVLCFIWYYLRPVEQSLHLGLLKMAYFGFNGMNVGSFILAIIQSYIWGYIGAGIWWLVACCGGKKD